MKQDIHPKYKQLKLKIGKDVFTTYSTYGGDEYLVDIDYRKHPAWDKKERISANESNKSVSEFNKKYSGFNFGIKK